MRKLLSGALFILLSSSAFAVEPSVKHVFVKESCTGPLGATIVAAFRQEIRASAGYQLASSLADDGGNGVVAMVSIVCVESAPSEGVQMVSVAVLFGTGGCMGTSSCSDEPDENTLGAYLAGASKGQWVGKQIYAGFDEHMSGTGSFFYNSRSIHPVP